MVLAAACAVVIAAAAAGAASGAFGGGSGNTAAQAPSGPTATTTVQRTTLTSSQTLDGELGFGDPTTLEAPASDVGRIVTWMPSDGRTITRGQPVYQVDAESVPLLYGSVPLYRTLRTGSTGSDVLMLEQNLKALGYSGFTVGSTFDANTAAAVEKWQKALGRPATGEVQVGDAVVAPGPRRVAKAGLAMGNTLTGSVLTWTGTDRVITVDLPVEYAELARQGGKSTVTLPDSTTVNAVVTDIGTPTSSNSSSGANTPQDSSDVSSNSEAVIPVELTVQEPEKLGTYQAASVSVEFADESRENVLAVPVTALFALPQGGYAVEVVTGSTTAYRKVTLGMFGNGMVEVSGAGITAGTVVEVPA